MGSHLILAAFTIGCSVIFPDSIRSDSKPNSDQIIAFHSVNGIVGFKVQRMSGGRVFLSWHTENEHGGVSFEVLRKHGKGTPYISLGTIEPKSKNSNSADYSFIDMNEFTDSSFYCLKKTNAEDVIFYSLPKGISGLEKNR
jgi:hypothetical protein